MNPAALPAPTFDDLRAAAQRLHGIAHRTPVLRSTSADESTGAQVFFKCENLQRTGAFKFRGAYNTLAQFTPEQRERGVLAFSAGNHAQAIALSARLLDMPAVIVMPEDAPATKMAATREYGAQVVTYNRYTEDREAISRRLAQERGMTLVPPFDHPHVIAGQGTAAMELLEEVPGLDYLFVCVGGGGQLTFPIIAEGVEDMVTATDEQLVQTLRFFAERMKIVVEPTGALAFAGVRNGSVDVRGKRVGVLISGGNVDLPRYARFLAE